MSHPFVLPPPSSVPGPYRQPAAPAVNSVGVPTPRRVRWHVVGPGETLWSIAGKFYNNPGEYVRILNANRDDVLRPDKTFGSLVSTSVREGERLLIP